MDLRDMRPTPQRPESRLWYGTVAETVTALDDDLLVILPDFDPRHLWGPCKWQSRDAVSLPSKGDECVVAFDNRNNPWVLAWWPY
jgi:hypothetical protein